MRDRDQQRVLNAGEADELAMASADAFVQCETKQIVHQFAEFAVAAVDDQFGPRNRQWRRAVTPARLTRGRTAGMAGEAESGTFAC